MDFYYVTTEDEKYAEAYYDKQERKNHICDKCGAIYLSERMETYRVHFEGKKLGDFIRNRNIILEMNGYSICLSSMA